MKVQDQYQIKPETQSCQTSVMVSADYKGYSFDEDNTGYAPKHLRFSFFTDDGETFVGSGESIEDCKQQIDELMKTEFKGSEGKWGCVFTSDKKRAVRNKGGLICSLYHPSKYPGQDERYDTELEIMRADQRLIAKAPELIKMLVDIFEQENLSQSCHDEVYKLIEETLT